MVTEHQMLSQRIKSVVESLNKISSSVSGKFAPKKPKPWFGSTGMQSKQAQNGYTWPVPDTPRKDPTEDKSDQSTLLTLRHVKILSSNKPLLCS
jgi:hypothetical protein